jgi:hypothetical protein
MIIADYTVDVNSDIVTAAQKKLERIIEREGDAGGLRRSAEYLKYLIAEEIMQRQAIAYCRDHYKGK